MIFNGKIIGLCGRKQSGKTELASVIYETFNETKILSFATSLKLLCAELLNMSLEELNDIKNETNAFNVRIDEKMADIINKETNIKKEIIFNVLKDIEFTSVRMMLQIIGTNLIRTYSPDWHVNKLIEYISEFNTPNQIIVVDDCRFPNEKKALEEIGGITYFIIKPDNKNISNHESETSLKWTDFNYNQIVINDKPLHLIREYWRIEMLKQIDNNEILLPCKNPIIADNNQYKGNNYAFISPIKNDYIAIGALLEAKAINWDERKIKYVTDNKTLYKHVSMSLFNDFVFDEQIHNISLENPFIIENLKTYIN